MSLLLNVHELILIVWKQGWGSFRITCLILLVRKSKLREFPRLSQGHMVKLGVWLKVELTCPLAVHLALIWCSCQVSRAFLQWLALVFFRCVWCSKIMEVVAYWSYKWLQRSPTSTVFIVQRRKQTPESWDGKEFHSAKLCSPYIHSNFKGWGLNHFSKHNWTSPSQFKRECMTLCITAVHSVWHPQNCPRSVLPPDSDELV